MANPPNPSKPAAAIRTAVLADVGRIHQLVSANAQKGGLLPRSEAHIRSSIANFVVAERGGVIVGCGSLMPMSPTLVELRSLAVDASERGTGVGKELVAWLVEEARDRKFGTIFALTRAITFFLKCGFEVTAKEHFPEKVWRDCVACPLLANCDEVAVTMQLLDDDDDDTPVQIELVSNSGLAVSVSQPAISVMDIPTVRTAPGVRPTVNKVVLAYSGGLDTSCCVPWLKETYGCEVVCFIADIGQQEDLEAMQLKAIASGASKCVVVDLRDEFANEYLFPLVQSGAIYEERNMLGSAIARPLIAKQQVEVAEAEGADAVAYGATSKGNDQVRFEMTYMALNPRLKVIAPWREWPIKGREDALAYARARNIPITESLDDIYSDDDNLWHVSHEGGMLEDPWLEPEPQIYQFTTDPAKAPDKPEYVEIEFISGMPKRVNGKAMGGAELIRTLNLLGARHGVGRADLVENRLVGMKTRGVYETPGGEVLREAHQGLEQLALDRETAHYKQGIALKYAELVYNGQWFTPLRDALQAFITVTQRDVTGVARVRLFKGRATLVGRKAVYSLYREDLATFMRDDVYNSADAGGFIRIYGLPQRVKAQVDLARATRTPRSDAAGTGKPPDEK